MRASLSSSPIPSCNDPGRRADRSSSRSCCDPLDEPGLLLCNLCESWDTRTHVIGELFDTEKSYVASLHILSNKYLQPLRTPEYSGLVDQGIVDTIFYQIPEILNHHESFFELLEHRVINWDSKQKVGDVFLEVLTKNNVSETYIAFINNWKSAKAAIKEACSAKPAFAKFLEVNSREHKGKLTLDALLIMPVQRIPRYELLIKELLKHTPVDHPDYNPLVSAQKEVHQLALKINRVEQEAMQVVQLAGAGVEVAPSDHDLIRHDTVLMPSGLETPKERCLFLFPDSILFASSKRKCNSRKSSSTSLVQNSPICFEMNKVKVLSKIPLKNLEISKSPESGYQKLKKEIENLVQDVAVINQIRELVSTFNNQQQVLEHVVNDITCDMLKLLNQKQSTESEFVNLELSLTHQESIDTITVQFPSPETRASWEAAFNEAKLKLAKFENISPEFLQPLPIRKTRAGLQFTCAAATLGQNQQGLRDVWVCNSDGYVGQVCVLSLIPEPTVLSCNGVCNARILTVASVPASSIMVCEERERDSQKLSWTNNTLDVNTEVEMLDEKTSEKPNVTNLQFDSDSSNEEEVTEKTDEWKGNADKVKRKSVPQDTDYECSSMWLGTEDGCILVYNCSDNIRTKKNKTKIQLSAPILCIIYLDNKVFASSANGEIFAYKKDSNGGWCTSEPQKVVLGTSDVPVTKLIAVGGKLWCSCQNNIYILNPKELELESSFPVSSKTYHVIHCMATSGLTVFVALHHNAILKMFHSTTYECLLELNVAPEVTRMLAACDDIIRQHKSACLRITALLTCKDVLWIGTSAGVILTLPLSASDHNISNLSGLPYGHTGHVRFLTSVNMNPLGIDWRSQKRVGADSELLVISGGDGFEDFQNAIHGETAGRDDSTNHLLIWKM